MSGLSEARRLARAAILGDADYTINAPGHGANDTPIPPEDEALLGFPSAPQVGKIYYRTALAFDALGDRSEARRLLRVAQVYLPHDQTVKKSLASLALKLG